MREPEHYLAEIVSADNSRFLYSGTHSKLSWMDNDTSEWTDIYNAPTNPDAWWKGAALRTQAIFTNNVDEPQIHTIGSPTPSTIIADLSAQGVTKAKVVVQYNNVMVLMNLGMNTGQRLSNRIWWSDYRNAASWALSPSDSIAGFKDLDDGEQILNSAELGGVLYIWTDRAIWRMFPQVTDTSIFGWNKWYGDPKHRTACLAYENALVATGKEFFWFGRNTIFWANQFSSAPTSPDWLLKGSGLVFEGDSRVDPEFCESPTGGFVPDASGVAKEAWFSYPRLGSENGVNDYAIVLSFNTDSTVSGYATADHVDHGFTAFTNFSRTTDEGVTCNTTPVFIGASGADYCLKSIGGGVFYREMVNLVGNDPANDIPDASWVLTQQGYYSQLLLLCPFGYERRDKILRNVILSHDTRDAISATPNMVNLSIGNSYHLADPLETGQRCATQWHQIDAHPLQCPDVDTLSEMEADGTRPDDETSWPNQSEQGAYLYLDVKVQSFTGAAPIGGDSAWNTLTFDYLILP